AKAVLAGKAKGFEDIIKACQSPEGAQNLLVTELLPQLVREQVQAIQNLKIDKITVWDGGKGSDGKSSTANFLSGMVGSVPPLHEIARNAGVELPAYLGKIEKNSNQQGSPLPETAPKEKSTTESSTEV
ncbi:MAG: flotillin family protein, partial [Chthoniobacterales bacterium]